METLLLLFGRPVTAFGVGAALALLLGLAAAGLRLRGRVTYGAFIRLAVLTVPLVLLFSRLMYVLANCTYYLTTLSNPALALRFWDGGYSVSGAVLGALAAAPLAARWTRVRPGILLDAAAVGLLPAILVERLCEHDTGMGFGRPVGMDTLLWLGVDDGMGDLVYPVYLFEAIVAAIILLIVLIWRARRRTLPDGEMCLTILTLLSASQVILESLRNDQHMVVHFVRIQQVAFLLIAVFTFAWCLRRAARAGVFPAKKKSQRALCWLIVLICVGLGVWMEFRVDRGTLKALYYSVMTLCMGAIAALTLFLRSRSEPA